MKIKNVVSLFDGKSCGQLALQRAGVEFDSYYASEIDKYAIQIAHKNFPNTIQIGDVTKVKSKDLSDVDLLIGGSPCQGFSFAGKQLNFEDPRSKLFFEFVRLRDELKPKYFLLENVKMKKEYQDVITKYLGVEPIEINSNLLSAQNRKRIYWTNIPEVTIPNDKGLHLQSILQDLPDDHIGLKVREKSKCIRVGGRNSPFGSKQEWDSPFQRVDKRGNIKKGILKAGCLTGGANSGGNHSDMDIIHTPHCTRRYSVIECERLQTVPDNYTEGVSNSQRYKMLGNGWTVDVIVHIFKNIK
jgi:DNA-cytosine methyltransferase